MNILIHQTNIVFCYKAVLKAEGSMTIILSYFISVQPISTVDTREQKYLVSVSAVPDVVNCLVNSALKLNRKLSSLYVTFLSF